MRAMFGSSRDQSHEKNKVKEADTVKVPAFHHAELPKLENPYKGSCNVGID